MRVVGDQRAQGAQEARDETAQRRRQGGGRDGRRVRAQQPDRDVEGERAEGDEEEEEEVLEDERLGGEERCICWGLGRVYGGSGGMVGGRWEGRRELLDARPG